MTIIAAMNDTAEDAEALDAAADEARRVGTGFVVVPATRGRSLENCRGQVSYQTPLTNCDTKKGP